MAAVPFDSTWQRPAWVSDLLTGLGSRPVPLASLVAGLRVEHPELTAGQVEALLLDRAATHETSQGWVDLVAAADGAILTHVLTTAELAHGVLIADGDLDLWARLADGAGLPYALGGEIRTRHHPGTATGAEAELVGPEGWLAGLVAGRLVGLRLRGGMLELVEVEPLPPLDQVRARQLVSVTVSGAWDALAAYLTVRESDSSIEPLARLAFTVADLVATYPAALTVPLPPIPDLLRLGGLVVRGGRVALPGLPVDPAVLADLSDTDVRARVAVAAYARAWAGGDPVEHEDGALFLELSQQAGVLAHLADLVECDPLPVAVMSGLRRLARTGGERAVVELLAARSAEGMGRSTEAEPLIATALELDPELRPAVLDAAEYAATRGDVVAAAGFLKRAGLPDDDPRRVALAKVVTPPATAISRSDPCPCGSGMAYRRCCLRFAVHPLPVRAALLYARLAWYAHRAPRRGTVAWLERLVDPDEPHAGLLPIDLAIFDTGIVDDYLAARGERLRPDERALLERWRSTPIDAYEVVAVTGGTNVTLRPFRGGDLIELRNRALAAELGIPDVLVARLLPDGDRGFLVVPPRTVPYARRRDLAAVLADYSPGGLAALFGSPPLTSEGDRTTAETP